MGKTIPRDHLAVFSRGTRARLAICGSVERLIPFLHENSNLGHSKVVEKNLDGHALIFVLGIAY